MKEVQFPIIEKLDHFAAAAAAVGNQLNWELVD